MSDALSGLQPEAVWRYFGEISRIPRSSKNEAAIARYVVQTAQKLGCTTRQDAAGNVILQKPASPGREGVRSVCLQGHLDMVCEKNSDVVHDFEKDPIKLVRKENALMADGTTLGADNGIAVAISLAIIEDRELKHGPLEFLLTVDEETGLTGASALQADLLSSRTLINLDSEEEGSLYVGCAGGLDTSATFPVTRQPVTGEAARLTVKGLRGGHSGLDIARGRGNAIKILTRVMLRLAELGARIDSIDSGNKHNAIPREGEARLILPKGKGAEAATLVRELEATLRAEIATVDPGLAVSLELLGEQQGQVLEPAQQQRVLWMLAGVPHGVTKMSPDIPDLVETSTNLAVVKSNDEAITLQTSQRSSVDSEIAEIGESVAAVLRLAGADVHAGSGYPGWKPDLSSEILGVAKSTYVQLFGSEPEVKAIHAGLECGLIGAKISGMDMVSCGPTIEAVHSPDEKIYIDSVERFFKLLCKILENVN